MISQKKKQTRKKSLKDKIEINCFFLKKSEHLLRFKTGDLGYELEDNSIEDK